MTHRGEHEALLFKTGSLQNHFPSTNSSSSPHAGLKRQVQEHMEAAETRRRGPLSHFRQQKGPVRGRLSKLLRLGRGQDDAGESPEGDEAQGDDRDDQ